MDADLNSLLGENAERLLLTMPAGVFVAATDGDIRIANARAEELWGGPLPNCLERGSDAWYEGRWLDDSQDLEPEQWPICRALKSGERIYAEIIDITRFDGSQATIIAGASPLRNAAGEIAGAIGVIQDVTEPRERHRTDALLLGVLSALAGSLDLSEVLSRLVRVLLDTGSHTRASVMLWHEETQELEIAAMVGEPRVTVGEHRPLSEYSAPFQRAIETRQRLTADFSQLDDAELGIAARQGIRMSLIVPLVRGDDLLGVATVDEMRPDTGYSSQEVALVESIASLAALAIENARLYEAEHRIAFTLQRALLALPDRIERLAFAHAYRSASEAAFVGGDFYDLFEIEHDLVGVLIGDIAGKGIDAAVLTQLVKNTIRAHAAEKGGSPATILRLTNDILFQATSPDMFATAFFGVLDRDSGRLVYTNAGHTNAIVARSAGDVLEIPADSPLLGAFAHRTFVQTEITIAPGDLLVLYTDGVTEARAGQRVYGEERVLHCVERFGTGEPGRLVRAIVDDVLGFTGGSLTDDLAILVVQRLAESDQNPTRQRLEVTTA